MSKGKVAVIEICSKCPYKAFDNTMGLMINHDDKIMDEHCSEIAYCGWFKPLDNTKLRIEEYLNIGSHKFGQPDNCPLPDGNDGSKWRNVYGENAIIFGENMLPLREGLIRVGDRMRIAGRRHPPPAYGARAA